MPEVATVSRTPNILPYFEQHYQSTTAISAAPWFFYTYVSRARKVSQLLQGVELEDGEPAPTAGTISSVVRIISKSKASLKDPEVSVFHGEAIVTWKYDGREVSLVSRGLQDDPKLLKYVAAAQNDASEHDIRPRATAKDLDCAIAWLYHK